MDFGTYSPATSRPISHFNCGCLSLCAKVSGSMVSLSSTINLQRNQKLTLLTHIYVEIWSAVLS